MRGATTVMLACLGLPCVAAAADQRTEPASSTSSVVSASPLHLCVLSDRLSAMEAVIRSADASKSPSTQLHWHVFTTLDVTSVRGQLSRVRVPPSRYTKRDGAHSSLARSHGGRTHGDRDPPRA